MPTYEYLCSKCRHSFDAFQSIKAQPLKRCPKCKGKVQRQIGTGAGIIFKGTGFYATDYRKSSASAPSESKTESKSEAKSDTKSEPKKEAGKSKPKD